MGVRRVLESFAVQIPKVLPFSSEFLSFVFRVRVRIVVGVRIVVRIRF